MRRSGWTLVEMMVVTSLLTVIMGVIISMLFLGQNTFSTGSSQMVLGVETRRAIESMTREVAETRSDPAWLTFPPADGRQYTRVTFALPQDRDGDGTVFLQGTTQLEPPAQLITYQIGGANRNQLIRDDGVSQTVLANQVTDVQFRRPTAGVLEVQLTSLTTEGNQRNVSRMLTTRMQLRN